jgi:SAM-dependent methyltransferase
LVRSGDSAAWSEVLTTLGGSACPACGGAARPRIDLGDFRLYACATCECWSSDALVRGARTSFQPNAYFANADADAARWDALLRRIRIGGSATTRVLDVGCGRGDFLAFVARRIPASERSGIEIDAERARDARNADPQAPIATGAVEEALADLRGSFDLVTLWDVLEHLADPGSALRALAGRLAPGGSVFVQTIHEQSLVPRLGRGLYRASRGRWCGPARRTHEPHHLVFFSLDGLRRLADQAGLSVQERWFDRLVRARMDGSGALRTVTAAALAIENALGNGLFVNLLLTRGRHTDA